MNSVQLLQKLLSMELAGRFDASFDEDAESSMLNVCNTLTNRVLRGDSSAIEEIAEAQIWLSQEIQRAGNEESTRKIKGICYACWDMFSPCGINGPADFDAQLKSAKTKLRLQAVSKKV